MTEQGCELLCVCLFVPVVVSFVCVACSVLCLFSARGGDFITSGAVLESGLGLWNFCEGDVRVSPSAFFCDQSCSLGVLTVKFMCL